MTSSASSPFFASPHGKGNPPHDDACVLCGSAALTHYHQDKRRHYVRCEVCSLVQVPPAFWLSAEAEKAVYDAHDNDPGDTGYRRFLSRTATAVKRYVKPPAKGLDFGCGPGPALAAMFSEAGYEMALYDHFYYPDTQVLIGQYHFVTATEVVEHLHNPAVWLDCLWERLVPGGVLALQTKRVLGPEHFKDWHYTRDPTHIVFFSLATLHWLSQRWQASMRITAPDVVLYHKPNTA